MIQDSLETLRLTEADLSARIKPIEERLAVILEQKSRLAEDWIMRHLNGERFNDLKDSLDREEARLKALKTEIDPAQIERAGENQDNAQLLGKSNQGNGLEHGK